MTFEQKLEKEYRNQVWIDQAEAQKEISITRTIKNTTIKANIQNAIASQKMYDMGLSHHMQYIANARFGLAAIVNNS